MIPILARISRRRLLFATGIAALPSYGFGSEIIELAKQAHIPVVHESGTLVQAGGALSYGADWVWTGRRAAYYAARTLKRTSPSDLPVERPKQYSAGGERKGAARHGNFRPPTVLLRANRVIE